MARTAPTRAPRVRAWLGPLAGSVGPALLLLGLAAGPLALAGWALGAQLAAPAGLALLALAGPLLALWMLRPRRERRRAGSLLLWREAARADLALTPLVRLRRGLVLGLQLAALAALAAAAAAPWVSAAARDALALVLVVDTSASMLARDEADGARRLDVARQAALELVAGLGDGDAATLVVADRGARTVVPWTSDLGAVRRALERLEARHLGTDLDDALALAAGAVATAPAGPVVHVLSDGARPAGPARLGAPLRWIRVGTTGENLALVAAGLRPRGTTEPVWEVFASVLNAGAAPREVVLGLERDGLPLAARRVAVPAGGERVVTIEARLLPGPVSLRLRGLDGRPPDAQPTDDVVHLLVPRDTATPVGLAAAAPAPALARALDAAGARVRALRTDDLAGASDPGLRLVVYVGAAPPRLPPRDVLLVAPPGDVGPARRAGEVEGPLRVVGWDRDDPLLRWADLDDVTVARAARLELGPGARALVQGEAPDGAQVPLVVAWHDGPARRVLVAFDPGESTWPLRASFPIFVRACLVEAAARDPLLGTRPAGEPVLVPVAPGVATLEVTRPDGRVDRVAARDGLAVYGDTDRAGVYVARAGGREERFSVALLDALEARLAPGERLGAVDPAGPGDEGPRRRALDLAPWLALAALGLLALEAAAYHRRW